MHIYDDNTKSIGRTPLIRINRLDASSGATILAKIE
jgi:cysteine synthase A